jgi:hypothetical protein
MLSVVLICIYMYQLCITVKAFRIMFELSSRAAFCTGWIFFSLWSSINAYP